MRAILIATGYISEMDPLLHESPSPLLKIAGKPILVHILEYLVGQGVNTCDIVLHHLPERVEREVGEGERWGLKIHYHLAKDPRLPFKALASNVGTWEPTPLILGTGDTLPYLPKQNEQLASKTPTLMMYGEHTWSEWALFPDHLTSLIKMDTNYEELFDRLCGTCSRVTTTPFLSTRTPDDLRRANQRFLSREEHPFPSTARMVKPGVWVSRRTAIHPKATLIPPAFIGEHCQIQEGAIIGPNAVIENHCVIDTHSTVEDSVICPNSYVGASLEIRDSIVDRSLLINLALDTTVVIHDDTILSDLSPHRIIQYPVGFLERLTALLFTIIMAPFFLLMWITHRITKKEMLKLPASSHQEKWQTFPLFRFEPRRGKCSKFCSHFFRRLPVLLNIIRGEVHFVGVQPRTHAETRELPREWRHLYLSSKIGLITLSSLDSQEDRYASEVYYASHMSWWFDVKLFFRWLAKKFAIGA